MRNNKDGGGPSMAFYLNVTLGSTLLALAAQAWQKHFRHAENALTQRHRTGFVTLAVLSLLPYCLTMGLRYAIGTDYFYTYVPTFELAANGVYTLDFGYRLLMRFVLFFTDDPTGIFLLSACVIVGLTGKAVWKYSELPWVSILLFAADRHFFISMNGMRQYMGLAVVIGAYRYVREKCLWKYVLVVLAASLFHTSMLIFLPLGLLMYLKIDPLVGGGIVAVLSLMRGPLTAAVRWVVSYTRFAYYYNQEGWVVESPYHEKFYYLLILVVIASIFYWQNKDDPEYRFLYSLELIVLYLSFNRSIVILADRLCWSLEFFHLLLIPKIIVSCKSNKLRWIVGAICVGVCAAFCYFEIFYHGYHEVYPYQSIFSPAAQSAEV